MNKIGYVVLCAVLALGSASAEAGMKRSDMESWERRMERCGQRYQYYYALRLEPLLPAMKEEMLRNAVRDGASQGQLEMLDELFEEGRQEARDKYGWDLTGNEVEFDDMDKSFIERRRDETENLLSICVK